MDIVMKMRSSGITCLSIAAQLFHTLVHQMSSSFYISPLGDVHVIGYCIYC